MHDETTREGWWRAWCHDGEGWIGSPTKNRSQAEGDCVRHRSAVPFHRNQEVVIYETDDARANATCEHTSG